MNIPCIIVLLTIWVIENMFQEAGATSATKVGRYGLSGSTDNDRVRVTIADRHNSSIGIEAVESPTIRIIMRFSGEV